MRSDSSEAIKAMVRAGLGISLLFLWNIDADLQRSRFQVIQTDAPPLVSRIALIRLRGSYTSKPVWEFLEMARRIGWKHLQPVKTVSGGVQVS